MKVLAVCGMGLGSSLILRMQVEKALKKLGLKGKVEVADMGSARSMASSADLIVTSKELAERMKDYDTPIVTISNYMDLDEMMGKIREATGAE
jgi:PTS system ascorbate-specific IIB component